MKISDTVHDGVRVFYIITGVLTLTISLMTKSTWMPGVYIMIVLGLAMCLED